MSVRQLLNSKQIINILTHQNAQLLTSAGARLVMLPHSKSYTVLFTLLQQFCERIIKSSEDNKMLKGGKDHSKRKSCRIRINYFTEQSKMGFIQNILGPTENPPLKLTSSDLASTIDIKLCSKITTLGPPCSGTQELQVQPSCALLVCTLVDSALPQDHVWCFFHQTCSSSHWAWMVLHRQAAAQSCTLFSLYDDALQTV